MDKDNREKAQQDSANDKYDPPHSKPGGGWLNNYTEKEVEDQREYRETWRANRDNIEKQK